MVFAMFLNTALAISYDKEINKDLAVVLIDADSGKALYEQRADDKIKPASTTKILTCIIAIEEGDLSSKVTVSQKAAGTGGSFIGLKTGEEIVLEDLLIGMMYKSGNDAAVAVAEHIGGSVDGFAEMMNSKAKEIGMTSSHFVNPNGLDNDEHFVTARDMTLLGQYAMKNSTFMNLISNESHKMPKTNKQNSRVIENFDLLIRTDKSEYYQYANGMKTGSTRGAGGCLVASATKDGQDLVCVVFGDNSYNKQDRWSIVKSLFDYGFNNFTTLDVLSLVGESEPLNDQVENYAANDIYDGTLEFVQPMPEERFITVENDVADKMTDGTDTIEVVKTFYDETLTAPIYENDVLGTVEYKSTNTGTTLFSGNLVASRDVEKAGSGSGSIGDTAVMTMPPTAMEDLNKEKDNSGLVVLLVISGGLIAFLVIRIVTVKQKKRKKYRRKRPSYSYKIKR